VYLLVFGGGVMVLPPLFFVPEHHLERGLFGESLSLLLKSTNCISPQLQIPFLGGMGRSPVHRRCFCLSSLRSYEQYLVEEYLNEFSSEKHENGFM